MFTIRGATTKRVVMRTADMRRISQKSSSRAGNSTAVVQAISGPTHGCIPHRFFADEDWRRQNRAAVRARNRRHRRARFRRHLRT